MTVVNTTPTVPPVQPNTPATNAGNLYSNIFGNSGKTLEKIVLYVVGILTATNVIDTSSVSHNTVLVAIAAVLTGLNVSTPTPKSGPGQL